MDVLVKNAETQQISLISLYCQNLVGYRNLTRLVSKAYLEGQKAGEPIIEWDWLVQAKEGLIVLSGGKYGDIGHALLSRRKELANQHIKRWMTAFPDHFYIELQRTGRDRDEEYLHAAVELAKTFKVPVVATNDIRFIKPEDFEAHEARVCIHEGRVLSDENGAIFN